MIDMKSIRFPPPVADEMVRAILGGRKTVTRRVVKLKFCNTHLEMYTNKYGTRLIEIENEVPGVTTVKNLDGTTTHRLRAYIEKVPPYRPGDILYVRETWRVQSARRFDADARIVFKAGGDMVRIRFPGGGDQYHDRREYDAFVSRWADDRWHPSIHMPREAARIFLRVADVRVERLQDITETQAMAEGAIDDRHFIHSYDNEYEMLHSAREHFTEIWNSTIKKADRALYGWEANPYVWVIEFERCEKPEAVAYE